MKSIIETLKNFKFNIIDYILEAEGTKTKFDNSTSTFDDLIDKNPELNACKNSKIVNELLEDIISYAQYRPKELFIYASKSSYFKIPYAYYEALLHFMKDAKYKNIFKFKEVSSKKIQVSFVKGGPIFETGSGSISRVSTEQQESATCVVWNAYVDTLRKNEVFDTSNIEFIRSLVKELTDKFDEEWITTFGKQCVAITSYLKKIGCNPTDYKMCRYGEEESSNKVSNAYSQFVANYIKKIGGQKDNFDPSDVLIYLEKEENNIIKLLNEYTKDPINKKSEYLNNIFEKKLLQGISLKKIVGTKQAKYSKYNTGDQNEARIGKVHSYNVIPTSGNNVIICAEGNFKFDDITDSEGNEIETTNSVKITLRTFGNDTVGMDVCINEKKSPSLGKCPARIWREVIGLNPNKTHDINKCIDALNAFIKNNNEELIKEKLKHIIASAVKEGPACFPFILLH